MVIGGKGVPLRVIMRDKLYTQPGFDIVELQAQLKDAAKNASHSGRRMQYGAWALELVSFAVDMLDLDNAEVSVGNPSE